MIFSMSEKEISMCLIFHIISCEHVCVSSGPGRSQNMETYFPPHPQGCFLEIFPYLFMKPLGNNNPICVGGQTHVHKNVLRVE
jgi:hypothetical protein